MSPDNRGSTVLKRNRISQHGALARSELIGFAILVKKKKSHCCHVIYTCLLSFNDYSDLSFHGFTNQ